MNQHVPITQNSSRVRKILKNLDVKKIKKRVKATNRAVIV